MIQNPPQTFRTLASAGIPVLVPSNGTIATNGTVTLVTALPVIYPYAWCYFPANAVSGGSAGLYYVQFTSTTVGQVYTNYVDASSTAFTPFVPTSLVAATGSNSAYTQTTASALTLLNITVPAGAMGANGIIQNTMWLVTINNANTHTFATSLGTTSLSGSIASVLNFRTQVAFNNMGDQSHQAVYPTYTAFGGTTTAQTVGTTNTANATTLKVTLNLATATDYGGVQHFLAELMYQP